MNLVQTAFNGVNQQVKALSQGIDTQLNNRIQAAQQRIGEFNRALRTGDMNNTVFAAARNAARETQAQITVLTRQISQARTLLRATPAGAPLGNTLRAQIAAATAQLGTFQGRLRDLGNVRTFESIQTQIIATGRRLEQVNTQIRASMSALARGIPIPVPIATLRTQRTTLQGDLRTLGTQQQTLAGDPATHRALQEMRSRDVALTQQLTNELKANKQATEAIEKAARATWEQAQAGVRAYLQSLVTTGSLLSQIGGQMQRLGVAATAAGAGLLLIGKNIVGVGMAYQLSIDTTRSVISNLNVGTTEAANLFAKLEATILQLAATTKFTSNEVAEAAKFLGQAGLTAQEVMSALPATLNLSMVAFVDLGRSAEIAADFMNAFQLRGAEVSRVVDVLAKGEVVANTTLLQLANAFSFAAPVAASLGQTIEDTAAALSLLSNSGIKASRAGTGLAQIMSGLIRDTEKTAALMERYGSSFDRVNPQIVSIIDVILEFKRVGVSAADVMEQFGERAGRAMLALVNAPVGKILEISDALHNSFGEAVRQAALRTQNLSTAIAEFNSRLELIKITAFKKVEDDLKKIVLTVTKLLDGIVQVLQNPAYDDTAKAIIYTTTALAALLLVVGPVVTVLGTMVAGIGGAITGWASLGISAQAASAQLVAAAGAATVNRRALLQMAAAQGLAGQSARDFARATATANATLITEAGLVQARVGAIDPTLWGSIANGWTQVGLLLRQALGLFTRLSIAIGIAIIAVYGLVKAWAPLEGSEKQVGSATKFVQVLAQTLADAKTRAEELNKELAKQPAQGPAKDARNPENSIGEKAFQKLGLGTQMWTLAVELLEAAFRQLFEALSELWSEIGPTIISFVGALTTLFAELAKGIAGVPVALLASIIGLVTVLIRVLTKLIQVVSLVAKESGYWILRLIHGKKYADDYIASLNKMESALDKVNKQQAKTSQGFFQFQHQSEAAISSLSRQVSELNELSGLIKQQQARQLQDDPRGSRRLAHLEDKYGENPQQIADHTKLLKQRLGVTLQAAELTTASSEMEEKARTAAVNILKENLRLLGEVNTATQEWQNTATEFGGGDQARRDADATLAQRKALDDLRKDAKDRVDEDKKASEVREKIHNEGLSRYEKELEQIQKLGSEWTNYYDVIIVRSKNQENAERKILQDSIKLREDLLAKQAQFEAGVEKARKAEVEGLVAIYKNTGKNINLAEITSIAQQNAQDALIERKNRIMSLDEGIEKLEEGITDEMRKQHSLGNDNLNVLAEVDKRKETLLEKEAKTRQQLLEDQVIREAKIRGDEYQAKVLDAARDLEVEKKKIEDVYTLKAGASEKDKQLVLGNAQKNYESRVTAALQDELKARNELVRDQSVRMAKARGDDLATAKADIERDYQQEVENIQKKTAANIAGNAEVRKQLLKNAEEIRQGRTVEAEKEDKEKRMKESLGKLKEAANPILKVHEEAAQALAKQVKSVQDLITLYNVMYTIRMNQERRAFVFSMAAATAQRQAASAAMRAQANPDNQGLQMGTMKAQQRSSIFTSFAGKALTDAGVAGVHKEIGQEVIGNNVISAITGVTTGLASKFEEAVNWLKLIYEILSGQRTSEKAKEGEVKVNKEEAVAIAAAKTTEVIAVPVQVLAQTPAPVVGGAQTQVVNAAAGIPGTVKRDAPVAPARQRLAKAPRKAATFQGIGVPPEPAEVSQAVQVNEFNKQASREETEADENVALLEKLEADKRSKALDKSYEDFKNKQGRTSRDAVDRENFAMAQEERKVQESLIVLLRQKLQDALMAKNTSFGSPVLEAEYDALEQELVNAQKELVVKRQQEVDLVRMVPVFTPTETPVAKERTTVLPGDPRVLPDSNVPIEPPGWLESLIDNILPFKNMLPNLRGALGGVNYENFASNLGKNLTPDISSGANPGSSTKNENTLVDNRVVTIDVKNEIDADRFQQMLQQSLIQSGFSAANV